MRKLALVALLAALAPWAHAQRMGASIPHHHPIKNSAIFFADPFYSAALYHEGSPPTFQPSVVILQAEPAPVPDPPSKPTQPLLIELQGGRYVRISGQEPSTGEMKQIDPTTENRVPAARRSGKPSAMAAPSGGPELTPAILVFRDGRRQEVGEYTIADGILYTHADYYTDGSWNKKIALSSLNLPETIAANQSRGTKFQLPNAPNEVIVRP